MYHPVDKYQSSTPKMELAGSSKSLVLISQTVIVASQNTITFKPLVVENKACLFPEVRMLIVLRITVCVVFGCVWQDVPQVTLPGSTSQMTQQQEPSTPQTKPSLGTKSIKQKQKEEVSKHSRGNRSLLGVIWNRFGLWPGNQMKLPDDKNPSVCV